MEPQVQKTGFWADFRHFFLRGLAAILPSLLSLVLIVKGYQFISKYIGGYVNWALIRIVAVAQMLIFGGAFQEHVSVLKTLWDTWHLHIGGFAIAIALIYFFGIFLASFVGRWIWRVIEAFLKRTPVLGQVYPPVKQVTDFFLSDKRLQFSQVVAVEYPRNGIWSLGLLTGQAPKALREKLGDEMISVFIPSSPTPLTGYVICTHRSKIIELAISIDDAFKFIISGGVLKPSKFVNNRPAGPDKLPAPKEPEQQNNQDTLSGSK